MSIEERNNRATVYIRKCRQRNKRKAARRLHKIRTAIRGLYYSSAAVLGGVAVYQAIMVIGK